MQPHLKTIVAQGILPLTSVCNTACIFCSHRYNPEGIQIYRREPLQMSELEQVLPLAQRLRTLTIGESVTTTIEGEPLTHPNFLEITDQLRRAAPELILQITTNGILLSKNLLQSLRELQPLELTISLNSVNPLARKQLMGQRAGDIRPLLDVLGDGSGPAWHASVVAMPQMVGVADVLATLAAAASHGAKTIRVFWPGFTRLTPDSLRLSAELQQETECALNQWAAGHHTPLLVEPTLLTDLWARVQGVVAGTAAARAGVLVGDVILAVNGQTVVSRSDAFWQVFEQANPILLLRRAGANRLLRLEKPAEQPAGLVFHGDLTSGVIARLRRQCKGKRQAVVLTSLLGISQVRAALAGPAYAGVQVRAVQNHCFGGSIACAGLLTVSDFQAALCRLASQPELVIIPSIPFDQQGCDLLGVHYRELQSYCQRLVVI
jgi:hypothetical protein